MNCISAYIFNVFMETLYPRKYDNRRMYWLAYLCIYHDQFWNRHIQDPFM